MHTTRNFDIVLLGATGFTGALTAQYLASTAGDLRWAIAGRSRDKLESLQARLRCTGARPPELVVADVTDGAAVRRLVEGTRVVITTVGPYIRYGEPLVAACARAGTDYVDLTGEPKFVDDMISRHHAQAVASGAKIVHACGFDSLPHDLGVLFTVLALRRRVPGGSLDGTAVTVEGFVRARGRISGGTWQSILLSLSDLRPFEHPAEPHLPGRQVKQLTGRLSYRPELGFWAVPMPSLDPQIVCRSARLMDSYGADFRYAHYLGIEHLPQVGAAIVAATTLLGLSKLGVTRRWLARLRPAGDGPSDAQRSQGFFRVILVGKAGLARVRCEVRGGDPGHGESAKMLAEAALCLARDRERLPAQAGVITSAAAFGEVLIERLSRAGILFEEQNLPEVT